MVKNKLFSFIFIFLFSVGTLSLFVHRSQLFTHDHSIHLLSTMLAVGVGADQWSLTMLSPTTHAPCPYPTDGADTAQDVIFFCNLVFSERVFYILTEVKIP